MRDKLFDELNEASAICRKNYKTKKKEFFKALKFSLYQKIEDDWSRSVDEVINEIKNGQNFVMLLWEPYKELFEEYQLKYFENEKLFSHPEKLACFNKYSKMFENWFKRKGYYLNFRNNRGVPPDVYIYWYKEPLLGIFKSMLNNL
jgi:ABC-type proline/glycine betaine transport system substrate-binding protein